MYKNIHTILLLLFGFSTVFGQQKTQINPVPRSISDVNFRVGCSLFTDPNNYSTGSSFSYNAPINNNSNLTTASGTSLGCMYSVPNQAWFIITVNTGGNLYFNFSNSNGYDVDAVIWGPIAGNDVTNACSSTQNYPTTCDWDAGRPDLYLYGAQAGQKYVMLVTNYSNANTVINISQPSGGSVTYSMVNLPNCSLVPSASISGTSTTINEGQAANLSLSFTGSSPWNYTLSDGTSGTTFTSPVNVSVYPTASQTYTINSVNNLCGTSGGSGSVGISVVRNVQLKSCLPLDGDATDSQGLNSGSLQNGVIGSTNRNLEANKALQFDGIDDYVSISTNQLNNNTFAFASWVKLDELPNASKSESIVMSIGGTSDEHYLGVEYTNGNPSWKFASNGNTLYSNAIVDLNWHLLLGVRTGGVLKIFVDGVLTGSVAITGNANYGSPLSARIGSGITNTKFFKGKIDDVKIFNGSLIEPEILLLQNYNSCNNVYNDTFISVQSVSTSVICTGASFILRAFTNNIAIDNQLQFVAELSDANGNFGNPTTIGISSFLPLTASVPNLIAGGNYKVRIRYGALVSVNDLNLVINNPATYSISGSNSITLGQNATLNLQFNGTGPWNYTLSDGSSGTATTPSLDLQRNLNQTTTYSVISASNICGLASIGGINSLTINVLIPKEQITCFPFNGNTVDQLGNNTATLQGPIFTENRFGQINAALSFNGQNNYIEYTTNRLLNREYTFSAWVFINSLGLQQQYILSQGDIDSKTFQGIYFNSYGWSVISYSNINGGYLNTLSNQGLGSNQWIHITGVRTYSKIKLYVNGVFASEQDNNGFIPFKSTDVGRIGANSSILGNFFNGKMDDVRLHQGALNDEEVFALYSNSQDCPTVENTPIIVLNTSSTIQTCSGKNINISYKTSNVGVNQNSPLIIQLSDANGSFSNPQILGTTFSSPQEVLLPVNLSLSNSYRIRLVSSDLIPKISLNYLQVNISAIKASGTISGNTSITYGNAANLQINFTGTAPWNYSINGGVAQSTNTNPIVIPVSPFQTTQYQITYLSNFCGSGERNGVATVTVAPHILIQPLPSQFCTGSGFYVSFNSNFNPNPLFYRVQLSNSTGGFDNPITIGSGSTSPIHSVLPSSIPEATSYKIRIVTSNPDYVSNEISSISIKVQASANLTGNATINEGDSTSLAISFSGTSPWTFSINNAPNITTSISPHTLKVKPLVTTEYFLTHLTNLCGYGNVTSDAKVKVINLPISINCFQFEGNLQESIENNLSTYSQNISYTNDRMNSPNSALQLSNQSMLDIGIPSFLEAGYSVSFWFKFSNDIGLNQTQFIYSIDRFDTHFGIRKEANGTYSFVYYDISSMELQNINLEPTKWNHFVLSDNDGSLKLFINGKLKGEISKFTYISGHFYPTATIRISEISGLMDDFKVFKFGLTPKQVLGIYSNTTCTENYNLPVLEVFLGSSNVLCPNRTYDLEFETSNILPTSSNPVVLELSDNQGSFENAYLLGSSTLPVGNFSFQLPLGITTGGGYKLRLRIGGLSKVNYEGIIIKQLAFSSLSGSSTIDEGNKVVLNINFTGTAPFQYAINNEEIKTSESNILLREFEPISNTSFALTNLSNGCGTGVISGTHNVTVNPVPIRLISCFPFNNSVTDIKSRNTATLVSATPTTNRFGELNQAYYFNGFSDIIKVTGNSLNNKDFSMSLWFSKSSEPEYLSYLVAIGSQNKVHSLIATGFQNVSGYSTYPDYIIGNQAIILNTWYNLVLVRTGNTLKLFINGQLKAETLINNSFDVNDAFTSSIGGGVYNSERFFHGKIDDVQIYKGALTAGQVQALYQNTNPCFDATTYTCLSDNLFTTMLSGQQTLQVSNQIIGRSNVQTGANIHFDSKNSVLLEPGFKTEPNTIFKATVGGGCN